MLERTDNEDDYYSRYEEKDDIAEYKRWRDAQEEIILNEVLACD